MICVDNLETGSLENIAHLRDDAFAFINHDVIEPIYDRRAGRLRLPPRRAREPGRLPARAARVAEGRLVRHAQRARPREVEARAVPDLLDERGLRRPAGAPAARDVLGQRQPDRAARRLRRGEALRRGADDDLPLTSRASTRAIARIFNTYGPRMRRTTAARRCTFLNQAIDGQAADRLRRRLADALALLRRRPDPRPLPARDERRAPAGEPRQPRSRGDDARARADRASASPARRARSCSRRCRSTTRRSGAPTSRARARSSAGSPRSTSRKASRRWLASLGREPVEA